MPSHHYGEAKAMTTLSDHLTDETLAVCVEGNLGSRERRRVEAHLAACPACLERLVTLQRLLAGSDMLEDER